MVPGKYVARSQSGKAARVLYDKLQEIKGTTAIFNEKNEAQNCKLPRYKYSIFIIFHFHFRFRKGRLIERGVYLTNQLSYGGV